MNASMRLKELEDVAHNLHVDQLIVYSEPNIRALTGLVCDHALLVWMKGRISFYTDFRYVPMVHRLAPELDCRDIRRFKLRGMRIGCEFTMPHNAFESLRKEAPQAEFIDASQHLSKLRAVKTPDEIRRLRAAETLTCDIWREASSRFAAGMTEREMANLIRHLMIDRADGEAFSTIVCIGANAAECHHEPDDTVWNGRDAVLVDMGVRLEGVCGDLTRNILPKRQTALYRRVYDIVRRANLAAISAARPGMKAKDLDRVARDLIRKEGFGECFGHSLGHGVGYEIHEAPTASRRSTDVLEPGMLVTIEPGIYLEGNLGVRIEDLILITEEGCEVLSSAPK